MVASPIVAFSGTGPEGAASDPAAHEDGAWRHDPKAGTARPTAVAAPTVEAKRPAPTRRTARRAPKTEHAESAPVPSQISVDCAQDMCVIQNGLEVTVMAGR